MTKAILSETPRQNPCAQCGTPIPRPDGKILAWRETTDREVKVETPAHVAALATVLGAHAQTAVETKLACSIESIKEAARKACDEQGIKRGVTRMTDDEIRAKIVAAGGAYLGAERYNRCPTCEQWSPCDVRKAETAAETAAVEAMSTTLREHIERRAEETGIPMNLLTGGPTSAEVYRETVERPIGEMLRQVGIPGETTPAVPNA